MIGGRLAFVVANDNQRVKIVAMVAVDGFLRAVNGTLRTQHGFRHMAAGAEDRAALGEDARKHVAFQQVHLAVLNQAEITIPETHTSIL